MMDKATVKVSEPKVDSWDFRRLVSNALIKDQAGKSLTKDWLGTDEGKVALDAAIASVSADLGVSYEESQRNDLIDSVWSEIYHTGEVTKEPKSPGINDATVPQEVM